jgi:hypothetical protein
MSRVDIDIASVVDVLRLSVEQAAKAVSHMRVDLTSATGQYSIGLLLTIIDHVRSVITLANASSYTAIPIVARSCLEGYVDLVNLCDKADY